MAADQDVFLEDRLKGLDADLAGALRAVAAAVVEIAAEVRAGGALGEAVGENVQGETQKALDVRANDLMVAAARACPAVAAAASEEMDEALPLRETGALLLLFDPLDGSSNIDVNAPIGTIVSILRRRGAGPVEPGEFLQPGRAQAGAAYALYGPQTVFCFTAGSGVESFLLDPASGRFRSLGAGPRIAAATKEFAVNMSNQRHWAPPVRTYVEELLAGREGPRGKDFNMRWLAAMVGDVHRILRRGGVFLYPWDAREPGRAGKLRLMYEANPLGLIVEAAGGRASTGSQAILDIVPEAIHQRVSVVLGAREEVERVEALLRG